MPPENDAPPLSEPTAVAPRNKGGNPNWVKGGPSGNPGGHPGRIKILREKIHRGGEELVDILFAIARAEPVWAPDDKGHYHQADGPTHSERIQAIKTLLSYGYGQPKASVELTGPDGGPIQTLGVTAVVHRIGRLTTGAMRRHLAELEARRAELVAAGARPAIEATATETADKPPTGSGDLPK